MAILQQIYNIRWLLLAAFLLFYSITKYRQYARLRAFKGPFLAGWTEIWHSWAILGLQSHLVYKDVCDKYGSIARVGPNDLVTSSPELLAHMSSVRAPYTRSAWYYAGTRMLPGRDHVFSLIDEEKHRRRRQQMAAGYSGKENLMLESSIDEHVRGLVGLIRAKYLSTATNLKSFDLAEKIQYLTLDVISTIGFGKAFGDLEKDADVNEYIKSAQAGLAMMNITGALGLTSLFQWPPLAGLLGPSEKDATGMGRMMASAREAIEARLSRPLSEQSDMLASFTRHGLSKEELFSEALLQIIAGSETTAAAIRAIMAHLIPNRPVYAKLQAEIDAAVASKDAPASPEIVSYASARNLPYLNAVINEGLRIHPPITDVAPKVAPKDGEFVTVDGKPVFLPGGTHVGYSVWGLHRRKDIFGEDADQFRPERWLIDDEEQLTAMRRTTELIFGYGKYQCLGKPVAFMEMTKAVFELLRHFDWSLASLDKPWQEKNYWGIYIHGGVWVSATGRHCN